MKLKNLFIAILLFLPSLVSAADNYGLKGTADTAGLTQKYGQSVPELTGTIIGSALSIIGVIFFILLVYGGFLWMTARGEEGPIKKAQETIIAATIGLIIVLGSYAITNFVFQSAEADVGFLIQPFV